MNTFKYLPGLCFNQRRFPLSLQDWMIVCSTFKYLYLSMSVNLLSIASNLWPFYLKIAPMQNFCCGMSRCFMLRPKELLHQAQSQLILNLKRQLRVALMQPPAAPFKSSWTARSKTLCQRSIKQESFSGCTIKVHSSMPRRWFRHRQLEVSSKISLLWQGYVDAFLVVISGAWVWEIIIFLHPVKDFQSLRN